MKFSPSTTPAILLFAAAHLVNAQAQAPSTPAIGITPAVTVTVAISPLITTPSPTTSVSSSVDSLVSILPFPGASTAVTGTATGILPLATGTGISTLLPVGSAAPIVTSAISRVTGAAAGTTPAIRTATSTSTFSLPTTTTKTSGARLEMRVNVGSAGVVLGGVAIVAMFL